MKTTQELINYLRQYNQWRRGEIEIDQPHPKEVGEAIDQAVDYIESVEQYIQEMLGYRQEGGK